MQALKEDDARHYSSSTTSERSGPRLTRSIASFKTYDRNLMAKELGVGIIGCAIISTTYFSFSSLQGLKGLACADSHECRGVAERRNKGQGTDHR